MVKIRKFKSADIVIHKNAIDKTRQLVVTGYESDNVVKTAYFFPIPDGSGKVDLKQYDFPETDLVLVRKGKKRA